LSRDRFCVFLSDKKPVIRRSQHCVAMTLRSRLWMPILIFVLAVSAWASMEAEEALAKDGECNSNDPSGCALHALQMGGKKAAEDLQADLNITSEMPHFGYQHFATTTTYGDSSKTACGGLDTAKLVAGTPYHNVASAQSMWLDCKDNGNCWCSKDGGGKGTVGMGCLSCAKGRFVKSSYGKLNHAIFSLSETNASKDDIGDETEASSPFVTPEIVIVVGDLCPTLGNDDWCPRHPGEKNAYGSMHHFDFSHPPKSIWGYANGARNLNFVFTKVD